MEIIKLIQDDSKLFFLLAEKWLKELDYIDYENDKEYYKLLINHEFSQMINNGFILAAKNKNKLIGFFGVLFASVILKRQKTAKEHYVYILPEYRKQGIANELLQNVINICKELKINEIRVYPNIEGSDEKGLEKITNLYKKSNFKRLGHIYNLEL